MRAQAFNSVRSVADEMAFLRRVGSGAIRQKRRRALNSWLSMIASRSRSEDGIRSAGSAFARGRLIPAISEWAKFAALHARISRCRRSGRLASRRYDFSHWRAVAFGRASHRRRLQVLLADLRGAGRRAAWLCWVHVVRSHQLVRRAIAAAFHVKVKMAVLTWRDAAVRQVATRQAVTAVLQGWVQQGKRRALTSWVAWAASRAATLGVLRRGVTALLRLQARRCLNSWTGMAERARAIAALAAPAVGRLRQGQVGNAWSTWREATAQLMRRAAFAAAFVRREERRALNGWMELLQAERAKRGKVECAVLKWRGAGIRKFWQTLYALAMQTAAAKALDAQLPMWRGLRLWRRGTAKVSQRAESMRQLLQLASVCSRRVVRRRAISQWRDVARGGRPERWMQVALKTARSFINSRALRRAWAFWAVSSASSSALRRRMMRAALGLSARGLRLALTGWAEHATCRRQNAERWVAARRQVMLRSLRRAFGCWAETWASRRASCAARALGALNCRPARHALNTWTSQATAARIRAGRERRALSRQRAPLARSACRHAWSGWRHLLTNRALAHRAAVYMKHRRKAAALRSLACPRAAVIFTAAFRPGVRSAFGAWSGRSRQCAAARAALCRSAHRIGLARQYAGLVTWRSNG